MSEHREEAEPMSRHYQSEDWIRSLLDSRQLDHATASDVSGLDVAFESAVTGVPASDILDTQYDLDPGILQKNELLLMLLEQSGNRSLHIDDLIALLERQAQGMEDPEEVRYRQFMGILDILTVAAKNRGLIEGLKALDPEMTSEDE